MIALDFRKWLMGENLRKTDRGRIFCVADSDLCRGPEH